MKEDQNAYDTIGNRTSDTLNGMSRNYAANCLNQYTQVDAAQMVYDTDGNLVRDDCLVYSYDAENRMISSRPIAPSKGNLAVVNAYDHKHRRIVKRVERFDGDEWQTSETRAYTYDAFGRTISQSGPLAGVFRHRFSTKYFDPETGLYYYGYRFYLPVLRCWLTRDPIEERGGLNLYCMCENSLVFSFDVWGTDRYMTTFSANPTNDQWHVGVAVDTWKCSNGSWVKTGVATFDFGVDDSSFWNRLGTYFITLGTITENEGNTLVNPHVIPSSPKQDIEMLKRIRAQLSDPPFYSFFFNNCIHWATTVIDYGIDK